ncbi:MAG: Tetratricopeptide repeat protein [Verrucomicrobiales bacterium]|nr:Tetratricopeptide repeat protein [Verrucomicrobiales bacterium]
MARSFKRLLNGQLYRAILWNVSDALQDQFDDAMFDFSQGNADEAIVKLKSILERNPDFFDAQLALGAAYYAKGDFTTAAAEGHKAEKMRPNDQLVYTNLSRAYMKLGDKPTAEHYALQSRIASWRGNMSAPTAKTEEEKELDVAKPPAPPSPQLAKAPPAKFPDMPWKKNKSVQ